MKKLVFIMPLMAISLLASCGEGGGDTPSSNLTAHLNFDGLGYQLKDQKGQTITEYEFEPDVTLNLNLVINSDYSSYIDMPTTVIAYNSEGDLYHDFNYNVETGNLSVVIKDEISISAITNFKETLPTLEECSWDEINKISKLGIADKVFHVGEHKLIKYFGKDLYVRIMGFNHDDLADGSGKAGISMEFEDIPDDGHPTYWGGNGGRTIDFPSSDINKHFLNSETEEDSFLNNIPVDLSRIIKPVIKLVSVGDPFRLTSFVTKGFLIAYSESCEDMTPADALYEGDTYELYKINHGNISKKTHDGRGAEWGIGFITRSPIKYGGNVSGSEYLSHGMWGCLCHNTRWGRWGFHEEFAVLNGGVCVCFCI